MTTPITPEEMRVKSVKIAEAMGWTFHDCKYAPIGGGAVLKKFWLPPGIDINTLTAADIGSGPNHGRSLPKWFTDPAAAISLIEWMGEEPEVRGFTFSATFDNGKWLAEFYKTTPWTEPVCGFSSAGDTFPAVVANAVYAYIEQKEGM